MLSPSLDFKLLEGKDCLGLYIIGCPLSLKHNWGSKYVLNKHEIVRKR